MCIAWKYGTREKIKQTEEKNACAAGIHNEMHISFPHLANMCLHLVCLDVLNVLLGVCRVYGHRTYEY